MDIGMLWFDNDKQTSFEQKAIRAAAYYREKYGKTPNLCFVHPSTGQTENIGTLEVRTSFTILPNHYWIGINDTVKA